MKRLLIAALLATTIASPALAQRSPEARAERQAQRAERQAQRAQQPRAQVDPGVRAERRAERFERRGASAPRGDNPAWVERAKQRAVETNTVDPRLEELGRMPRSARGDRRVYRDVREAYNPGAAADARADRGEVREFRRERRDDVQDFRRERRDDRGDFRRERIQDRADLNNGVVDRGEFRRDRRDDRRDFERDRRADTRDFRQDRRGDVRDFRRDGRRDYRNDNRRWDTRAWRNDRRYDWRGYRNYNSRLFRPGRYYAPYGYNYGYRRFSIGLYLDSIFVSSRYFINDPWQYRLPDPGYGYRWVRYYNDVLLIDEDSGYVVDVIHDFFY